jgi:hypothetical protein
MELEHDQSSPSCCVPPGFRFHPTEEELVGYYLARKVAASQTMEGIIQEVDLYRMEPWDLVQVLGGGDHEQQEWYFFSYKDRKYPSGTRKNRATAAGFWKATGRDRPVMSRSSSGGSKQVIIGMRKTLVFYKGRAPHGRKTDWIMHEYRLQSNDINEEHAAAAQEEAGWVVCRAFQKPIPNNDLRHMMMMHPSLGSAGSSYHCYLGGSSSSLLCPPTAAAGRTHHDVESKTKLMTIPRLIAGDGYFQQQPPGDESLTMIQGGGGQPAAAAAGAIDWNFLD